MRIDRRTFLRWTGAAGLFVTAAPMVPGSARAAAPYQGPFYLTIHASGGWDPTLLCDPKGRVNDNAIDPVNMYYTDEIAEVGPFRLAPIAGIESLFQRIRNDVLVLNGIDCQTNSHETGTRYTWSGNMDPGTPSLMSLIAAAPTERPTLSFVTHGGYDFTDGVVAPTRLPDTNAIAELARPEQLRSDDENSTVIDPGLMRHLRAAREARMDRLEAQATLPRERKALSVLREARTGDNELSRLTDVLPSSLDNSGNSLIRQAQVSLACFKAGVTVSSSLSIGGFDTHGNHDNSHTPRMEDIVEAIDFILDEAERLGIADQLVLVVGSDFARTPWYNATNGKDHWSITSMLLMGPGIRGGRVIGATDDRQVPLSVNPNTLQLDDNGVRITPGHIHASLRKLAGIDSWDGAAKYEVGDLLPLFD